MEKQIARWSYWLGIACLVIAVVWRTVNAFGVLLPINVTPGHTVWYLSFFHASILFFVTTIATACYTWLNSRQS
jgi:uncharacterized membrane protein YhaH (DUF805 family)